MIGTDMFDPCGYEDESEWVENSNGNYVCLHGGGGILATVFSKGATWLIIINSSDGGGLVSGEGFDDLGDAVERADAILDGAECTFRSVRPATNQEMVVTDWQKQKTVTNGSPTYGRKHRGLSVSVKKAKSGQWFYVTYSGSGSNPPEGWYGTPEAAMGAFDADHHR